MSNEVAMADVSKRDFSGDFVWKSTKYTTIVFAAIGAILGINCLIESQYKTGRYQESIIGGLAFGITGFSLGLFGSIAIVFIRYIVKTIRK